MLLCKDCINYDVNSELCNLAARKLPTDLIHGKGVDEEYKYMAKARWQRQTGSIVSRLTGQCGRNGRFFVATSAGGQLAAMDEW